MISSAQERRRMVFGMAGLWAAATVASTAMIAQSEGAAPAERNKKVFAGEKEAKKLLLLMDRDQNGKVSKEEFMSFMEAEFERLDQDKNGELDVQELTRARVRTTSGVHR